MVEESALLDLKHLLMEAQQRVPPVLMALEDPAAGMDEVRGHGKTFSSFFLFLFACLVLSCTVSVLFAFVLAGCPCHHLFFR